MSDAKQCGRYDFEQLKAMVREGTIQTVVVGFTDLYGKLCGKRLDATFFVNNTKTHGCNYLFACDIDHTPLEGFDLFNWEKGFGDCRIEPDFNTLRNCSWHPNTAMVLADTVNDQTNLPIVVGPRHLLKTILAKFDTMLQKGQICKAAAEVEYYCYKDTYEEANRKNYTNLTPVSQYIEDYCLLQTSREEPFQRKFRMHLRHSGVNVEGSKGEAGYGQHELNVEYCDALGNADQHVVFKQCLKEVASQEGVALTFMAKPSSTDSGSSCHIHISLWNKDGSSAFYDPDCTELWHGLKCTNMFKWFLGGLIQHTNDILPFLAPTINSYKRYSESTWAPTRLAWSLDNRTAGFRVVGSGNSLRIEVRIPGADVNSYLAFAGVFACGLEGILNQVCPPAPFNGDVYQAKLIPRICSDLPSAIRNMRASKFANKYFGEDVIKHYCHFYSQEVAAYNKAVTDWEKKRYFERI